MSAFRVAVIGGGRNPEHDVSVRGAAAVSGALQDRGHEVVRLTIRLDGVWCHDDLPLGARPSSSAAAALGLLADADAAFPVLHGASGEDGAMAGFLDLAGVPVVGCGVRAGALAMDKHATKAVAASLGIPVAPGVLLLPGVHLPDLPVPAVVKPTSAGSSFGVSRVTDRADLSAAITDARRYGEEVLVEEVQHGAEVHLAVLERPDGTLLVPPPIEFLVPEGAVFDTSRKYDGSTVVRLPASVPAEVLEAMRSASTRLFRALGCRGLSRFDWFVSGAGYVLNEVNTMPGMTAQSGFPRMCAAAGVPFPELVEQLVVTATAHHGHPVPA